MLLLSYFVHIFERESTPLTPSWSATNGQFQNKELLEKLDLRSIYGNKEDPMLFRFWSIGGWGNSTVISVRISKEASDINVVSFQSMHDDEKEFKIINKVTRKLEGDEVHSFLEDVKKSGFLWEKPQSDENIGMDGSTWVVEAKIHEKYISHDQWSPSSGPMYKFSHAIIELSELNARKL
jgi:hypothetical protein